jgi:F-type H+-transporting ATPase subunit delta
MKTTTKVRRTAKQLFRLCLVNGRLDEDRVRQAVRRMAESKRRGSLALLAHFRRLVKLESAQHTAAVESAQPLSADLRNRVQASLEAVYGPGMNTLFAPNPALIGGMRIKVANDVYDGSVLGGLAALEKRF